MLVVATLGVTYEQHMLITYLELIASWNSVGDKRLHSEAKKTSKKGLHFQDYYTLHVASHHCYSTTCKNGLVASSLGVTTAIIQHVAHHTQVLNTMELPARRKGCACVIARVGFS